MSENVHDPDRQVFSPSAAAEWLHLADLGVENPEQRVRYLHKQGKLRGVKVLGRLAFLRSDLQDYTTTIQTQSFGTEKG